MDTGNTAYVLGSAAMVMLMTPGLAFFYGGIVRSKSVLNMMMMSFICLGVVSVIWVLGGFSLRGGEGSIVGVVLGAVLLQVLQNLVNLLGIPSSLNFAVMGSVILIGVLADQQVAKLRARRALRAQAEERPAAAE